jgi:hypothetical protein
LDFAGDSQCGDGGGSNAVTDCRPARWLGCSTASDIIIAIRPQFGGTWHSYPMPLTHCPVYQQNAHRSDGIWTGNNGDLDVLLDKFA